MFPPRGPRPCPLLLPRSPSPAGCAPARPSIAAGAALPSPIVAELVGREGFPAVTLDRQHGLWDTASMVTAVAPVRHGGAAPIVRVPRRRVRDREPRARFRRRGHHRADDQHRGRRARLASYAKFPPLGERSWGPHRATTLGDIADQKVYLREANEPHRHLRHDRDPHRPRQCRGDRGDAGDRCAVPRTGRPLDRAIDGADVDPMAAVVDRELDRIIAAAAPTPARSWALYCHSAERALALRQARRALPRRRQRHRLPARRRRGG